MIDTARLRWAFWRLLRGHGDILLDQADRQWELSPAERSSSRPALYPEGDLDKVRTLAPLRSLDREKLFIAGGEMTHDATRAFEFSDVAISGAYLYQNRARARYGSYQRWFESWGGIERQDLEAANLVTCRVGSDFFGHFLWDNLPMELLPGPEENPITLHAKPRWHEDDYRRLLSMPKPPTVKYGRVKKLTLYADYGQTVLREKRYRILRARLRQALPEFATGRTNPGVFITRGNTGERRNLLNEDEISALLQRKGFTVINPDRMSGEEIVRQTMDARIVIGVDGSHISHTLYTVSEDGVFLILQPPDRFSMVYKEFTDRLGISYAFIVGDAVENGFLIDTNNLERLLERL